ncbi:hypothetical protein [Blastopirellula marina]|uniref:DUF5673 domain-containing protein n=1 Tax=Blastopirellula marina TaxID=124 RepID=A0A2S8GFC7_9BACT|nr:hypothetical protein [Blastopirellula marina]PQO43149.1 hypothetical protein C5Y93_25935 [Blastopirellula marina]
MPNSETAADARLQFRLRQAALAFGAAAIVLAITAPWLRDFSAAQWLELGKIGLAIAGGWFLAYIGIRRNDQLVRRRNGSMLLDVGDKRSLRSSKLMLICILLLILPGSFQLVRHIQKYRQDAATTAAEDSYPYIFMALAITFQLCFIFCLNRSTRFSERGVSTGAKFIRWQNIKSYRWSAANPQQLRIGSQTEQLPPITIPPELREQVEAILRTHATGFIQSDNTSHSKD